MSDLVITPSEAVGVTLGVKVTVTLTNSERVPVPGIVIGTDQVIVRPTEGRITSVPFTIDLPANTLIAPANTYWLLNVGGDEFLLSKGTGSETIEDALADDLLPLDPTVAQQLVDAAIAATVPDAVALEVATTELGGDLTGTLNNAVLNVGSLPAVADWPVGTTPVLAGVHILAIEFGGGVQIPIADALDGATVDVVSNVATSRILGRSTAGSGDSEELTPAQVWTLLGTANPAVHTTSTATAGHGKTTLRSDNLGLGLSIYGNSADTQPQAALGAATLAFGAGGSSPVDVAIQRIGVSALRVIGALDITGTLTLPAGSLAIAALATNPLDLANATNPTAASAAFNTAVRASRIDQMATPASSTLAWTLATINMLGFNVGSGTAADGLVTAAVSQFVFGGGILIIKRDSGDTQASSALNITGWVVGAGGSTTPEITFARTGVGAATLTCATLTLAGNLTMNARSIITDTTTGLRLGTSATQKLGLWKTPVAQPTSAITAAAFVANSGTAVNDASTFGGYTLAKIAAALVSIGALG